MAGMAERPVDIHIDLDEIAPTLIRMMGDGGYAQWSQQLRDEIARFLDGVVMPDRYTMETTELHASTSKGAHLAISALTILLTGTGIGYAYNAKKTQEVVTGVWGILRKVLPGHVKIHVKTPGYDGTIEAPNAQDASKLFAQTMLALRDRSAPMKKSSTKRAKQDRDVSFKPRMR